MIPRMKHALSLAAVSAIFVLLLAIGLGLAAAASPPNSAVSSGAAAFGSRGWGSAFQGPNLAASRTATAGNTSQLGLASEAGYLVYLPSVTRHWSLFPDAPVLNTIENVDADGTYTVTWNAAARADAYHLQEDDNASFSDPVTHDAGPATSWSVDMQPGGLYYYRVKASNAWGDGPWSNVESVLVSGPPCVPDPPGTSTNIHDAIKVCPEQKVTGTVAFFDRDDVFKIECEKNQRLVLTLTGSNPDADLYVFAPDATDVNSDDAAAYSERLDSNEYIDYKIPYDGIWYIDVYAYQGSIDYELDIDLVY